jgi:hypothetical protein
VKTGAKGPASKPKSKPKSQPETSKRGKAEPVNDGSAASQKPTIGYRKATVEDEEDEDEDEDEDEYEPLPQTPRPREQNRPPQPKEQTLPPRPKEQTRPPRPKEQTDDVIYLRQLPETFYTSKIEPKYVNQRFDVSNWQARRVNQKLTPFHPGNWEVGEHVRGLIIGSGVSVFVPGMRIKRSPVAESSTDQEGR